MKRNTDRVAPFLSAVYIPQDRCASMFVSGHVHHANAFGLGGCTNTGPLRRETTPCTEAGQRSAVTLLDAQGQSSVQPATAAVQRGTPPPHRGCRFGVLHIRRPRSAGMIVAVELAALRCQNLREMYKLRLLIS
jgi:hypothetical protein